MRTRCDKNIYYIYYHSGISKLMQLFVQEELPDIVCLKNSDDTSYEDRKLLREASENEKFDSDYYL